MPVPWIVRTVVREVSFLGSPLVWKMPTRRRCTLVEFAIAVLLAEGELLVDGSVSGIGKLSEPILLGISEGTLRSASGPEAGGS
jgi:hypothetical protein